MPSDDWHTITGTRDPPKSWGDRLYLELRNGMRPQESWAVKTTRWIHDGSDFDIVKVKRI